MNDPVFIEFLKKSFSLPAPHSLFIIAVFPFLLFSTADWACKVVMLIGCPLLVAFTAKSEPTGIVARLCALLGSASYAIYAIYVPLMTLLFLTLETLWPAANHQFLGFAFLVAIVPTCLLIDKLFDEPVRRIASHSLFLDLLLKSPRLEAKHMNVDHGRAHKPLHSSPA